jgi:hypothetical protein
MHRAKHALPISVKAQFTQAYVSFYNFFVTPNKLSKSLFKAAHSQQSSTPIKRRAAQR